MKNLFPLLLSFVKLGAWESIFPNIFVVLPFHLQFQHQSSLHRSRTQLDLGLEGWTTKSIASDPCLPSLQVSLCVFTCSDVFIVALLGDRERTAASACHALDLRFDESAPTIAFRWQSHGVSMLEYR